MTNPFVTCIDCDAEGDADKAEAWQFDLEGARCPQCLSEDA